MEEIISRINRALSTMDLAKETLIQEISKLVQENNQLKQEKQAQLTTQKEIIHES